MFAYTGLKPEQMDQLAKDVSCVPLPHHAMLIENSIRCMLLKTAESPLLGLRHTMLSASPKPYIKSPAKPLDSPADLWRHQPLYIPLTKVVSYPHSIRVVCIGRLDGPNLGSGAFA